MIKVLPLDFLVVSYRILWKNDNAVIRLQIPALVPEIFKFEKCVKYANEMTDDVIQSTQYYIICVNRAILANMQRSLRSLKLGRVIVLYGFLVSKETMVLRRWEGSKQKSAFIKRADKGWITTVTKLTSRALALRQSEWRRANTRSKRQLSKSFTVCNSTFINSFDKTKFLLIVR